MKSVMMTRPTMSSIYDKDKPLQLPLLMAQKDDRMGMDASASKGVPSMPPPSHFTITYPCDHTLFPQRYPKLSNPSDHTIRSADLDPLTLPPKRQKVNQRSWMTPPSQQAHTPRAPGLGVMCKHDKTKAQKMVLPHSYPSMGMGTTNVTMSSSSQASTIITTTFPYSITQNFPETLYEILSDPANCNILSWLPHGKGFVILNRQLFASHILPQNFDGAKFTSFTRRLKRWKFKRVPRGPEMGAYFNKYFVRDMPDLVSGMMYGIMEQCGERGGETTYSNMNEQMDIMAAPPLPLLEEEDKCDNGSDDKSNYKSNVMSDKGDGKSDKGNVKIIKMMKKKGESSNKDEKDNGIDDVVMATTMELLRQQQRTKQRLKRDISEEMVMHNNTIDLRSETVNEKKAKVSTGPTESNRSSASFADAARSNAMGAVGVELRRQQQWLQQLNNDDDGDDQCKWTKAKEKRNETEKERLEDGASFGAAYDNDVVEAAMEVHRQQHHGKQQSQLQQQHMSKESENGSSEKIPKSSYKEDVWMHPQQQHQRPPAPSRRRSSSSENLSLMSHDFSFRNRPVMPRLQGGSLNSTRTCSNHPPVSIVSMAHLLNGQHQQQQLERHQQFSKDPSSLNPNTKSHNHYRSLRNESAHASQLRHQEDLMKRQIKPSTSSIPKELHMRTNLPTPYNPRQGNSSLDRPELYNPEDYLSVSTSRRVSLNGNMPMTHHTDKFHHMVLSRQRNATLSQHPYDISSSDYSSIRQQHLTDIEHQILSEMSGDSSLHADLSTGQFSSSSYLGRGSGEHCVRDPLSTNGYPRRRSRGDSRGMTYRGDRTSVAMLDRDRMLDNGTFMDSHDIRINGQDRFYANEDMAERILASSNTHNRIMIMAARDLQSRDLGRRLGSGSTALLEYHQLPIHLQQRRLSREHLLMQDQQQLQLSREHLPMQDQQQRHISQEHLLMRDQQQHLLSPSRLRQQQLPHISSLRTRYPSSHDMVLRFRELEEKMGLETLAVEAAASGLRERRGREGGGASAA